MGGDKPRAKLDQDLTYTSKFRGRTIRFQPKTDEVVVTFRGGVDAPAAAGALQAPAPEANARINHRRGFAAIRTGAGSSETAAAAMAGQPAVANAMPALVDDEGNTRYFLPDEFTVQFRKDVDRTKAEATISQKGCAIVERHRTPGYYTLAVPANRGPFEMIREFSKLDAVQFAEPSEAGFNDALTYIPDDPEFGRLWGLRNTGQTVNGTTGTAGCDIRVTDAWDIARGAADVIIAVVDTGADLNHPDLAAVLLDRGTEDWDFGDPNDSSPDDSGDHGTHVAGTAAAADDAAGIIGVAPGCRVMPLRVDLTAGMNQNRADAIQYVAAQARANPGRRYVINCSWRMSGDNAAVHNAIQAALEANVPVVFAAGNHNQDIDGPPAPYYPAHYPEVIAVAATDQSDVRATFSNFGARVSVSAPGVNIYSSIPDDARGFKNGTSMASPHVAGLAALVLADDRTLTALQVRQVLELTCDAIDGTNPTFAGRLGRGRINAHRALVQSRAVAAMQHSGWFIQGRFGARGNFEVVSPAPGGGLLHHYRDNDSPDLAWSGAGRFGTELGSVDACALIQGNFGLPGNLELVYRRGAALFHGFRSGTAWSLNGSVGSGVTGQHAFIQSRFGQRGNFEVVAPAAGGGLLHWHRNNDLSNLPWVGPGPVLTQLGQVAAVAMLQSNFGHPGNLELLVRRGADLIHCHRDQAMVWHVGPTVATGVTGTPAFVQSRNGRRGNFEAVVPRSGGGLLFCYRDNDAPGLTWSGAATFAKDAGDVSAVSLIQSNFGEPGNLELIVRSGDRLVHYYRDQDLNWNRGATLAAAP